MNASMRRVNVVGTSCSGKTTLSRELARVLGVRHVDMDELYWEADWREVSTQVLRQRVTAATDGEAWVVDGNYDRVRDILWARLDSIVWLDFPLWLVLWRGVRRTLRRLLCGESCCNGNRETLGRTFSKDSILLWVIQTHGRRRREYAELLRAAAAQGTRVVILKTPRQARRWLEELRGKLARASGAPLEMGTGV